MSAVEVLKSSETNGSTSSPIKPGDDAIQPSEAAYEDTGSKQQTVSTWTELVTKNHIQIQEHDEQIFMDSPLIFNTENIPIDVGSEMECVSNIEVPVNNGCSVDPSEASSQTRDPENLSIDVGSEIGCISDIDVPAENDSTVESSEASSQTDPCGMISIERFRRNNKKMLYFTGCESYDHFQLILRSLGPAAYCLNYYNDEITNMSIENQFLLTLIKLRLHWKNFILADMFDISEATVSNIFITWINFMYYQWKEIQIWPNPELISSVAQGDLSRKSPILIESIECPIKRPNLQEARQATFSSNKKRHTVKILVGATPDGVISCVSDAYGGSASDQQIADRSELMTLLDPSNNGIDGKTAKKDDVTSSKRAHIKRLIGRAKTYKILREPMSELETDLSTHILFVCCMLCNFKDNLIFKNA